MPRKTPFVTGEYYHIFNRGVEKRTIFQDKDDLSYFRHILDVFNDIKSAHNTRYHMQRSLYRSPTSIKHLVQIVSFCLMPNHYHLILQQVRKNGVSRFLQKLGTGYTHFFNKKYNRSGVLFQGKTKSKHIGNDVYYKHLQEYLYLNPLDLYIPQWKERGIFNAQKAILFLEKYEWFYNQDASFTDRMGGEIKFLTSSKKENKLLDILRSIEVGLQ
jgi:putative transposase